MIDDMATAAAVIALLLVIVGWFATHVFSEMRERRKEMRGQIDKLIVNLHKIEADTRSFHSAPAFDSVKANDLRVSLDRFERTASRMAVFNQDELARHYRLIRQGATLQNFEPSTFTPQPLDAALLMDFSDISWDIEDAMETQYAEQYPDSFPYFRFRKRTIRK